MKLELSAPALIFPAVSLLLLAYTNRFLALAALTRGLHEKYHRDHDEALRAQIKHLRMRIKVIRAMQGSGVLALFFCVGCMFLLFNGNETSAKWAFEVGLILLLLSLGLSVWEISISAKALEMQISDMEK